MLVVCACRLDDEYRVCVYVCGGVRVGVSVYECVCVCVFVCGWVCGCARAFVCARMYMSEIEHAFSDNTHSIIKLYAEYLFMHLF